MSLCRAGEAGGGWLAGYSIAKKLTSYKNGQTGLSCGHFQLLSLQNVAKSIPDINIHLARRFQPVGYLSASTRAI